MERKKREVIYAPLLYILASRYRLQRTAPAPAVGEGGSMCFKRDARKEGTQTVREKMVAPERRGNKYSTRSCAPKHAVTQSKRRGLGGHC